MYYPGDINSLLAVAIAVVILVFVVVAKVMMRREKRGQAGRSSGMGNAFLVVEAASPEVSHVLPGEEKQRAAAASKKAVISDKNK